MKLTTELEERKFPDKDSGVMNGRKRFVFGEVPFSWKISETVYKNECPTFVYWHLDFDLPDPKTDEGKKELDKCLERMNLTRISELRTRYRKSFMIFKDSWTPFEEEEPEIGSSIIYSNHRGVNFLSEYHKGEFQELKTQYKNVTHWIYAELPEYTSEMMKCSPWDNEKKD